MNWISNSTDSGITPPWAFQEPAGRPESTSILDQLRFIMLMWCQGIFNEIPTLKLEIEKVLTHAPMDFHQEDPIETTVFMSIVENQVSDHLLALEEYELLAKIRDWLEMFQAIRVCK